MKQQELEQLQQKALKQLRTGASLFGKNGALAPWLKQFLEQALEAEMESHLSLEERAVGNKRNGKGEKTIRSAAGTFTIQTPEDRHSTFQPQIVRKRETILADSLQSKIIGLYGLGTSYEEIREHIKEMYGTHISTHTLQQITDRIIPEIEAWQNRLLDRVYPIIWLGAMRYKVRDGNQVKQKALYNILALTSQGKKELPGVYLGESEGAKFWLQILTQLRNRGLEDILIACTDNLKGFSEAIASIYPQTEIQSCVVHQIRNSLRYIVSKDQKEFMKDLKQVSRASTKEIAAKALERLAAKWEKKYPIVIASWRDNWGKLTTYFGRRS